MTATESRLEIIHVVEASFAGVGRHVLDLTELQLSAGHSVSLFWSQERANSAFRRRTEQLREAAGLNVVETAMTSRPSAKNLMAARLVRFAARESSADIVHGHSTGGGMIARAAAFGTSSNSVFTPNAYFSLSPFATRLQRVGYLMLERLLRLVTDGLIVVSAEELAHAQAHRLTAKTTQLVPNGCSSEDGEPPEAIRQQRGTSDSPVIGFVGRMDAQKRPGLLIDAYASLLANELRDQSSEDLPRLFLVGDGPEIAFVRERISRKLRSEHGDLVTMFGELDGARSIRAFDVLAVPSAYEGFPYVVLEALSAGVPVVSTPSVPLSAFGESPAGIAVSRDDSVPGLAAALFAALGSHWEPSEIRCAALPFSVEKMADKTEALYRTVLGDPV